MHPYRIEWARSTILRMSFTFDTLFAAGALLVSVVALLYAQKSQRKAHELDERMLAIEEGRDLEKRKASLMAQIATKHTPPLSKHDRGIIQYHLVIENKGEAEASDIEVTLDGSPCRAHPCIAKRSEVPNVLGPRTPFPIVLVPTATNPFPKRISIKWNDASETPGSYESDLAPQN